MNHTKVLLLVFVFACLSGIGFTYVLYQKQSQAYSLCTNGVQEPALLSYKLSKPQPEPCLNVSPRPSKVLEHTLALELSKTKPVQRINTLERLHVETQLHSEFLNQNVSQGQKLCAYIQGYTRNASSVDPLLQKLALNVIASLEKKQRYAQYELESLEAQQSEVSEELETLRHNFLQA